LISRTAQFGRACGFGGRRSSNAVKSKHAPCVCAPAPAAAADLAHPGDNSKVVQIVISRARWEALFGGGSEAVDLRSL
jgi:hypothetical protein